MKRRLSFPPFLSFPSCTDVNDAFPLFSFSYLAKRRLRKDVSSAILIFFLPFFSLWPRRVYSVPPPLSPFFSSVAQNSCSKGNNRPTPSFPPLFFPLPFFYFPHLVDPEFGARRSSFPPPLPAVTDARGYPSPFSSHLLFSRRNLQHQSIFMGLPLSPPFFFLIFCVADPPLNVIIAHSSFCLAFSLHLSTRSCRSLFFFPSSPLFSPLFSFSDAANQLICQLLKRTAFFSPPPFFFLPPPTKASV